MYVWLKKMWLISNGGIYFYLFCSFWHSKDIESTSVGVEKNTNQFINQLGASEIGDLQTNIQQNLTCYNIQCVGEGCIHALILEAGPDVMTCTATGTYVCFVQEDPADSGITLKAGCGINCERDDDHLLDTTKATVLPSTTTHKTITAGFEMNHTTHRSVTTEGFGFFFPRKRRKRSVTGDGLRKCCMENYCNHDSHCGRLTCGAAQLTFTAILAYVMLAFVY